MSRYAKSYVEKTLDGTALQSPEDFTCLAILLTHNSLSKSDLINRNIQEKTSGTEVIRRLLQAGLVIQSDDVNDKRSKRISITDDGKQLLYRVFDDMNDVRKMVAGNLSFTEKLNLQSFCRNWMPFIISSMKIKLFLRKMTSVHRQKCFDLKPLNLLEIVSLIFY